MNETFISSDTHTPPYTFVPCDPLSPLILQSDQLSPELVESLYEETQDFALPEPHIIHQKINNINNNANHRDDGSRNTNSFHPFSNTSLSSKCLPQSRSDQSVYKIKQESLSEQSTQTVKSAATTRLILSRSVSAPTVLSVEDVAQPCVEAEQVAEIPVGESHQCTNIPELLNLEERQRALQEYQDHASPGTLIFEPSKEITEGGVTKVEKSLRTAFGSSISLDRLIEVYYKNKHNPLDTISAIIREPSSIEFAARDLFSPIEQNLFEIGMKVYGKKFTKIQSVVRTKTLAQVLSYYYYWKTTARYELFYQQLTDELFNETSLLTKRRAKMFLLQLQREGKDPELSDFQVNIDNNLPSDPDMVYVVEPDVPLDKLEGYYPFDKARKRPASEMDDSLDVLPPAKRAKLE